MALTTASTILPPDSFTRTWSPTLCLRMVAAIYHVTKTKSEEWSMITLMAIGAVGKTVKVGLGSAVVGLFLTLVVAALAIYGIINTFAARIILVLAGLVTIAGIATSDYVGDKSRKHVAVVLLISSLVIGSGLFWLDSWATRKRAEMDALTAPSKPISPSATIAQPSPTSPKALKREPSVKQVARTNSGHVIQQTGQNNIAQIGNNNQASIDTGRRLSREDRGRLITRLAGVKAKVRFASILQAPDSYQYALDLREAFKAAGIDVDETPPPISPRTVIGPPWFGTQVSWHGQNQGSTATFDWDSPQGKIFQALDNAHANPRTAHIGLEEPEGVITVTVGVKPEEKKD